jgi:hypothetical protein
MAGPPLVSKLLIVSWAGAARLRHNVKSVALVY